MRAKKPKIRAQRIENLIITPLNRCDSGPDKSNEQSLYRMSEVYSDGCSFKIPLSPFVKGGTGKEIERVQHISCDKKKCRSAGFPPLKKWGARGDFGLDHISSNRNLFMTKAINSSRPNVHNKLVFYPQAGTPEHLRNYWVGHYRAASALCKV